ncbi:hypothetical protein SAMN05421747_10825 [Parapedobacter composti]|uniref:Uncharacterized protein n=1 Tax=Parapedobacter composti TaxID=623281 RepID=A0A1I1I291_9SPHI|nr:hypothetical protein [Parapedobacter composti]SFC30559.1 hypothetical protein SAMN05421747_10825 [Parapedobacter composti]
MKLHIRLLAILFTFAVVSCEKHDEPDTTPDPIQLEIAGEGGATEVALGAGDWQIVSVVNADGNMRMFGDVYNAEGEIIWKNELLKLNGLGRLAWSGTLRGFQVIHKTPGLFHIQLQENALDRPFCFIIKLDNGLTTQEIVVEQPTSAGYNFERIEYFLEEGDGDSLYVRERVATYQFTYSTPIEVSINPFNGPNVVVNSHFESDDKYAFVWLENDAVEVPVPSHITEDTVYLSAQQSIYGGISNEPYQSDFKVTIALPAGQSNYASYIEERRRVVSYRLTMTHKGTGDSKVVEGKWIEISPTGRYEIKKED